MSPSAAAATGSPNTGSHRPARLATSRWCPGSDIRTPSRLALLRMSEPQGHQQILDSSVVSDLTFAWRTRGYFVANVKSTTLAGIARYNLPDWLQSTGRLSAPPR